MAQFYVYKPRADGSEPVGSENQTIWRDLTTLRGAIRRADRIWGRGNYRIKTFTNFFDDSTFRDVTPP